MSKNTKNYQLYTFTSDNDVADLKLLEHSFDTIDKGLVLDVGESTGNGNNYVLSLGSITLTSANKGISFKFWADKNASGAVKINGTYNLVKPNGNAVTNLKAGAPYTITYDGGRNFFLASGGSINDVNFSASDLLSGKTANDSNGEIVTGTMPNKGAVTATLNCGGSYTIPAGYHNGNGKGTANSLASQTSANAGAGDILSGKTAWVNGSKLTGTMPNRGEYQTAGGIGFGDDYVAFNKIPYGCYPQSSNGWAPEIRAKKTDVAAALGLTANKIVKGSTICGIAGTVTIQSLGGYSKSDIQNRGIITRYKVVKQSEKEFNTDGKSNMMYEVLQRTIDYVRSSGNKYSEILCIDNNMNDLIFCRSSGTVSTSYNEYHFDYLQYVDFNTFTTTNYISNKAYLPYDQVGDGKKYHTIPLTGATKYGTLVISEHRSGSSDGDSWCHESTIRLQTKALTYDLLTLPHYGWLFNYSASSDTFTTIEDRKEGSQHKQYKVTFKIVPEIVDKNGNAI